MCCCYVTFVFACLVYSNLSDLFIVQLLNYNYIYAINAWLLLSPTWLCFDWSMGCIPVITTFTDARCIAVVFFWFAVAVVLWHTAMCSGTAEQRYFTCYTLLWVFKHCLVIAFISLLFIVNVISSRHSSCLEQSSATCLVSSATDSFPESAEDSPLQSFFPSTHLTVHNFVLATQ